jgi:hypothetical protein
MLLILVFIIIFLSIVSVIGNKYIGKLEDRLDLFDREQHVQNKDLLDLIKYKKESMNTIVQDREFIEYLLERDPILQKEQKKVMKKQNQQEMIDGIIDNFDFNRVMTTMDALKWRWGGSNDTPTKQELIDCATRHLHSAIEQVLSPDNTDHKDIGWISASGGFQAQAWKTKKGNLSKLHLDFIVSEWSEERD